MPDVTLRLCHPDVPFVLPQIPLTNLEAARVQHHMMVGDDVVTALWRANVPTASVPLLRMLLLEMKNGGHPIKEIITEFRSEVELEPEPERPTSRMVMWNQVSGHELQFDMTADEMLQWQRLRRGGMNQYEALLHVMHRNEGVRKRIELHQKEAENYLREGRAGGISIVARPRVETRVVPVAEEEMSSSSSSTTTSVAAAKPTEAELFKSAAALVKELVSSQAFKDFAALTIQFAKVHVAEVAAVSIKVPQVDKTGAAAKPVEAGKLGSLAHALAVVQALPLPKKIKDAIASATGLGRVPTTPDALSAARSLVQSQLVKKPGSPLSAPASASPVAASPPVVEQVAEQQAVAAAVGKKRKSVDRTPAQSPVADAAAVASSPEKKAASPKKRVKTCTDVLQAGDVQVNRIVVDASGKITEASSVTTKASPKVRKTPSGGPKRPTASVTSVGGSEAVATQLAAGLVGAAGTSSGDDWSHLDAMEH